MKSNRVKTGFLKKKNLIRESCDCGVVVRGWCSSIYSVCGHDVTGMCCQPLLTARLMTSWSRSGRRENISFIPSNGFEIMASD